MDQANEKNPEQWLLHRYVRVKEVRSNGLVEFEFAVGDPETFVELLMPKVAFDEFCTSNHVVVLDERSEADALTPWNASVHEAQRRGLR